MTKHVIDVELPATKIEFKIGAKTYTLSLADKSRARINKKYDAITKFEDEKGDSTEMVIKRYQDEIDKIEKERDERELTDNPISNQEEFKKRQATIAKFQSEVDKNNKELDIHTKKSAIDFLDYLFGEGTGNDLYNLVDRNTIALSKIIFQIMTEFNRENDIYQYRETYIKKLAEIDKTDNEDDD